MKNNLKLGVLALGLLARLPGLAARPLWYDEAFAVLFSSKGPSAMAYGTLTQQAGVAADVHPLGYYSLLWGWGEVLGRSPLAVRALSVLIGIGALWVGMTLAERMFGRREGLLAGLLLALSPFQVRYSQEVRMYALLALLLGLVTLLQGQMLRRPKNWTWLAYGLLAAAAQYTHNLAALYLLPLAALPFLQRSWHAARQTAKGGALALLLYLPWLVNLPSQFARVRWAYWIPKPGVTELLRTFLQFVSGLPVPALAVPEVALLGAALFAGVLLMVIACLSTLRAMRSGERSLGIPLYLAIAPPALMFAFSQWQPVYLDRAMLPAAMMFMIWIAASLSRQHLPKLYRRTAFTALAVGFSIGLIGFYTYRGFPYAPYAQANHHIASQLGAQEIVLHSNKISAFPSIYYGPDLEHRYLADPPGSGSDTLALATQEVLQQYAFPSAPDAVEGSSGVWFLVFEQELEDYRNLGIDKHPAAVELESRFGSVSKDQFGDLWLFHYSDPGAEM